MGINGPNLRRIAATRSVIKLVNPAYQPRHWLNRIPERQRGCPGRV
jgi:hypothetical protein